MTDSVTEPDLETTGSTELPGKRLREAREAAGLSIVDLAQQLHLAPNVIEALEADDYDTLAGATYVTGYLRSYARRLGLDENDIAARVRRSAEPLATLVPDSIETRRAPVRSKAGMVTVFVIGVGLLAAAWWFTRSPEDVRPKATATGPTAQPAATQPVVPTSERPTTADSEPAVTAPLGPNPVPPVPATPVVQTSPAEPTDQSMAETTVGISADTEQTVSEAPVDIQAGAGTRVTEAPDSVSATDSVATATGAAKPETGPDSGSQSGSQSVPRPGGPVASASLEMAFHDNSWTEVRDSRGKVLVYQMVEAGSLLELEGVPPLSVLLGYAPGVSITYNGRPFDLSGYTRNDIARFKVGVAPRPAAP